MKRGPIDIPDENFERTVEYLEGGSGHERILTLGKFTTRIHYLLSWLNRAYKFDSIADFDENRKNLAEDDHVVFESPLTVVHRADINDTEIVGLSDESGRIELRYPYKPEIMPSGFNMKDVWNNPIHGADIGDKIRIYSSTFKGGNRVEVTAPYFISNDTHHERIRRMRAEMEEEFMQRISRSTPSN